MPGSRLGPARRRPGRASASRSTASSSPAKMPAPTPASIAAPSAVDSSVVSTRTVRPVTSAFIWSQSGLRAPPPTTRISSPPRPIASSRSTMSRRAKVHPSSTERYRWARPWLSDRPAKTPRARSFQRGAVAPDSVGRNVTPSAPGAVPATASAVEVGDRRRVAEQVPEPAHAATRDEARVLDEPDARVGVAMRLDQPRLVDDWLGRGDCDRLGGTGDVDDDARSDRHRPRGWRRARRRCRP